MRAVFVLFDSLNRHAMGCYGGAVPTPNFDRFAARALTFDNHFVGSLPCMPARRDLHTGRLNFMHRSWGPLEPFDNSMPELLKRSGVYTHLVSDHFHYLEDGGATYHNRYSTWDIVRGQEYDAWKAMVRPPVEKFEQDYSGRHYNGPGQDNRRQHQVNRVSIREEADHPGPQVFAKAFEFLDTNRNEDNWMLQVECFDPHEPFFAPEKYREAFKTAYEGGVLDWPIYGGVSETPEEIAEIRANYAALLTMCDAYFGKLLDYFDAHDLWKDTALILTTDHGYLMGEHDLWAKNVMPFYDEIARIPLLMHVPGWQDKQGQRSAIVTQTPDLMPTLLELFDVAVPEEVCAPSIQSRLDAPDDGRVAVYGMFGGATYAADARYRYFLYPPDLGDETLCEYTLMPVHMHNLFTPDEMANVTLHPALDFTKGMPLLRVPALVKAKRPPGYANRTFFEGFGTALYDMVVDPSQERPIDDAKVAQRLTQAIIDELRRHDATQDFYSWMGLSNQGQGQERNGRTS
jgi:arylsulfatase A-like enzyme